MRRLVALAAALAGLSAMLVSCGGGGQEAGGVLAVAFRLDEGYPVMVAYAGDPRGPVPAAGGSLLHRGAESG
jgi:hypothetical protein